MRRRNRENITPPEAETRPVAEGIDPDEFLRQHGIEDLADLQVEAHGRTMSLRNGVKCDPFAKMIEGMSNRLVPLKLPDEVKKDFFRGSILDMAASTDDSEVKQQFEKKN